MLSDRTFGHFLGYFEKDEVVLGEALPVLR
jgi:hypothetical protein